MNGQETKLICIRNIVCPDGYKYNAGQNYIFYKNTSYTRLFYTIYTIKRMMVSTVEHDFLMDNFIEVGDLEKIDKMYQSYLDVY